MFASAGHPLSPVFRLHDQAEQVAARSTDWDLEGELISL
jgi:hypothetical protein